MKGRNVHKQCFNVELRLEISARQRTKDLCFGAHVPLSCYGSGRQRTKVCFQYTTQKHKQKFAFVMPKGRGKFWELGESEATSFCFS